MRVGAVATYPNGRALFRAFQIDAFPRVHPHLLSLVDELRNLDGDAVRQLGRLGARRLGSAAHDRGGLHHRETDNRRQPDARAEAASPLDLKVALWLKPG